MMIELELAVLNKTGSLNDMSARGDETAQSDGNLITGLIKFIKMCFASKFNSMSKSFPYSLRF